MFGLSGTEPAQDERITMSFRDNLQHLRATRNMTQEQLAMLLGVSRQSVTKWEAEKSYPEMDKLLKICQIVECSLDDLVQGDLTNRTEEPNASVPVGLPSDVCGYDDHQRMMAWKIPSGIAAILIAIGFAFLFEGAVPLSSWNGKDGLTILIVLLGVVIGLAFFIPAGMAHSAFVKAHPYIEDFYTEEEKTKARSAFSVGLVVGIAAIFMGVGLFLIFADSPQQENLALFLLLVFIGVGCWLISHFGMMLGRTNVAEYNKSVVDELEMEEIVNAQVEAEVKDALLQRKRKSNKVNALCGMIMIFFTIIGLALLFIPILSSPDPSNFEPEGTTAMWFWLAWVVGGLICGIISVGVNAFGKDDK